MFKLKTSYFKQKFENSNIVTRSVLKSVNQSVSQSIFQPFSQCKMTNRGESPTISESHDFMGQPRVTFISWKMANSKL